MELTGSQVGHVDRDSAYGLAFADWLACACGGAREPAARAMRATGDDLLADVAFLATAGHVLDFDDTFSDGVAHVSAACAPAALALAARLGRSAGETLDAYAAGFEAMAALAQASHPALYDGGWHPTAVCGPVGAAVAASALLGLEEEQRECAVAVALLRAGGTRGSFGSDGKALQVGLAAAAGVQGALLARAGARVDQRAIRGPLGFEGALGASWPPTGLGRAPAGGVPAIERNWIKLHPSCLGTHSPIEAAALAGRGGYRPGGDRLRVLVSPLALQAAHLDVVEDGLSAKFSIPYCVAHTLIHGPPRVRDFAAVDAAAAELSRRVQAVADSSRPHFGALLVLGGEELARVDSPRGAPDRPASPAELAEKIEDLAGGRLDGALADLDAPACSIIEAAGLRSADLGG